jgi:adenylyltransferase/sulfurtransferase
MHSMNGSDMWSREKLAGYDPEKLREGTVVVAGCGAAGNNIVFNLCLSGVRELRLIDFDTVEPSNLTRSFFFKRERLAGGKTRHKAREVALGALALSYADNPLVRYAVARTETLGLGALQGAKVVISAVDSFGSRAWLARATRLLRIPFIEVGFTASQAHLSVYPNQAEDEVCWRCAHPDADPEGISCTAYARAVVEQGMSPATQAVAATVGALAAEACIQALHGEFPLGGKLLILDIRTGKSTTIKLTEDPECASGHRSLVRIDDLDVSADDPPRRVLELAGAEMSSPILHLPSPFVIEAPCIDCGARVSIMQPGYVVREGPHCRQCPASPPKQPAPMSVASFVTADSRLATTRLKRLGLGPSSIFDVEDGVSGETRSFRLAGTTDDIYTTLRRKEGRASDTAPDTASAADATATGADAVDPETLMDEVLEVADEHHLPCF